MKILIFLILTGTFCFAQYTPNDSALVKTTFTKEFNKGVIDAYLTSSDVQKVNAGLLCAAQSEDTSFVKIITKLNFDKFGKFICFALGQLGPSAQSSEYLLKKITDGSSNMHYCLEAIGKVGNINTLNEISNLYLKKYNRLDGISLALYNFNLRKIAGKEEVLPILKNELKNSSDSKRKFEAVFTIYRSGNADNLRDIILNSIKNDSLFNSKNKYKIAELQYLLASLRSIRYFPDDEDLLLKVLTDKNFIIKVEGIKAAVYYNYSGKKDLLKYLKTLDDSNPNIQSQAAISLNEVILKGNYKRFLKNYFEEKLKDEKLPENAKGNLFLTYAKKFNLSFEEGLKEYSGSINKIFLYEFAAEFRDNQKAFNYLLKEYNSTGNNNKIKLLESLIKFQHNQLFANHLRKILLTSLSSSDPAYISIGAEGADSIFIKNNKTKLKQIILRQVNRYLYKPNYFESLQSFYFLSKNISKEFSEEVLNIFSNSSLYSVKKLAIEKFGKQWNNPHKEENNFLNFWYNSFKYSSAEIETEKGKFTIEFLPGYAPITVGSFLYLAQLKIFNNLPFHRVLPGFVIQGGDPLGNGWGGPGYEIISEFSPLKYEIGTAGMANAGKNTEGSQWFITTGFYPHLNGKYSIFAKVTKGMKVVNSIDRNDKIIKINLFQ